MARPHLVNPSIALGAAGTREAARAIADDDAVRNRLAPLNCELTAQRVTAERALLAVLDGNCRTPIGGLAETDGKSLRFRGLVAHPDGEWVHRVARDGALADAATLGRDAGEELLARAGPMGSGV